MELKTEGLSASLPPREWIISLFLTMLVIVCCKMVVCSLWSPLAPFPGPLLAALSTNLYQAYYDVYHNGKFVAHLHDLHKQYGPVVRIGPNELHFSSPDAYKDIYHSGSKFLKDKGLYKTMNEDLSSFGTWDPVFHRKRRESMNPLFSRRAILKLESSIQAKVKHLVEKLSLSKGPIDLFCAFRCFSLDVVYDYMSGEDAGAISHPSFQHPIILGTEAAVLQNGVARHFPWIEDYIISNLPPFIQKRLIPEGISEVVSTLGAHASNFVERKAQVQQDDERETIFSRIVNIEDASWQDLFDEGMNLTFAGTDTGMSWPMRVLLDAFMSAWPDSNTPISYETLEKLPFLTAVIKESLRLSIGVPVGLLREVQPTSAKIMGYEIPRGTIVSMGATFMHWSPDLFPDPFKFSPDRWLQDRDRQLDSYLVPFSRGPRQCIGMNLAWCELYLVMGYLFRKLDLEIQGVTHQDMYDIFLLLCSRPCGGKHLKGVVKGLLE
ncbi:hypothetical protein D9758_009719 [Tetrapyrgos nigripes]|uniref:Cytochrome P450 n=1 Tax=Tetrapyrgos nigripes TaxID=182062 RepID=A0A8H5CQB4_9AGAR|nr:hypothetical protein D9758_009719 [Tetrapyrgos nigripes]